MMKTKAMKRVKIISVAAAIILMAAAALILFLENDVEKNGHYTPDYNMQDMEKIVDDGITDEEYKQLFFQTGLGKTGVDRIIKSEKNPVQELEKYQNNFFGENNYTCERITIITGEEQSVNQDGETVRKFEIQGLEDGDMLISLSTHSLGWRHGHAAIVADGRNGKTLECLVLGTDSVYQNYGKWELYPTFIQLRINETALKKLGKTREEVGAALVKTATEKLDGIPYDLFAGIPVKYVADIQKTHCAHLVWYAYEELGIDTDSDKGIFVTPFDLANSDFLEIVQIYGVNPEDYMRDFN